MYDRIAGVAGGIEHLKIGSPTQSFVGQFTAIDVRHDNVCEKQRDFRVCVDQLQRPRGAVGFEHLLAKFGQRLEAELADCGFVLDHGDDLLFLAQWRAPVGSGSALISSPMNRGR